ncbi:uncharacterized protein F5Z01DRAFT_665626 [Emericellopsis atlantica]|uniref:Uncharacterized protein n=1 Tax=Emericellopsis atlantica TaxID=2614577 RepID=A0A9P8CMG5_9HYPO|nr:uncharacterized protein F5Z01DRAFT_665626 [Emericellopsis atlantica]KAG9250666.1 hypothetical protein F5Z01DRAFT_665626 [Emericellopsis atlantica]
MLPAQGLPPLPDFDSGVRALAAQNMRRRPYTDEQADFIIYGRHEMRYSWKMLSNAFNLTFRQRRPRKCLQGCYYRKNLHVPLWDSNGLLVFGSDDALQPQYFRLRCDHNPKGEDIGLCRRYPERACTYSWVLPGMRLRASELGKSNVAIWSLADVSKQSGENHSCTKGGCRRRGEGFGGIRCRLAATTSRVSSGAME